MIQIILLAAHHNSRRTHNMFLNRIRGYIYIYIDIHVLSSLFFVSDSPTRPSGIAKSLKKKNLAPSHSTPSSEYTPMLLPEALSPAQAFSDP